MDERIFIVPAFVTNGKGAQFLVQDSDGQWYYLNHAHTWQTRPPPFSDSLAQNAVAVCRAYLEEVGTICGTNNREAHFLEKIEDMAQKVVDQADGR